MEVEFGGSSVDVGGEGGECRGGEGTDGQVGGLGGDKAVVKEQTLE